jgi:hypothetical protein
LSNGEAVPTFAEALDALLAGQRIAIEVKVPRAIEPVLDEVRNQNRARRDGVVETCVAGVGRRES